VGWEDAPGLMLGGSVGSIEDVGGSAGQQASPAGISFAQMAKMGYAATGATSGFLVAANIKK
jgi:hypothetical protein